MDKMNIRKYIGLLLALKIAGLFMYSCSEGTGMLSEVSESEKQTFLSVLLNAPEQGGLRSSGNPDESAESAVYSLDVFVFKSEGELEAGLCDGFKSTPREIINGNEYKVIDEVKDIPVTAGKRDIYVVANAPINHFSGVNNISDFLARFEELQTQGLFDHPGTVTPNPSEPPIGGIDPSDLKTNLTMCHCIKNVSFNNLYDQHYLGYTTNGGLPVGAPANSGWPLDGSNPFELERLVARVAIQKIEFDFPGDGLTFESGYAKVTNFNYHIDSVFMMNVKTASWFPADVTTALPDHFGHGCNTGYAFLKNGRISNLNPNSQLKTYLTEPIFTQSYDITTIGNNDSPLWYYVFENGESSQYPTYFVIGVRYNFESSKNPGTIKTVKCYYPVVVNAPGSTTAGHDYIKRNFQYGIRVKIKGLGNVYGDNPLPLRSAQEAGSDMEIEESVGRNLFPWTGNVYK